MQSKTTNASKHFRLHHFPRLVLFQNSTSKAIKMLFKICGEREKREKSKAYSRLEDKDITSYQNIEKEAEYIAKTTQTESKIFKTASNWFKAHTKPKPDKLFQTKPKHSNYLLSINLPVNLCQASNMKPSNSQIITSLKPKVPSL